MDSVKNGNESLQNTMGNFVSFLAKNDDTSCAAKTTKTVVTFLIVFLALASMFSGVYMVDDKLDPEEGWKKTVGISSIVTGGVIGVFAISLLIAKL